MKKISLDEIKYIELNILKQFKQFCDEKKIKYYLSNGTLLGAIKYKGFIPWDDDIDVFVPRADYERLILEFPLNDKLKLICSERDENCIFPFAKLSDMSTRIKDQIILNDYIYGIHIDIFPLDFWNNDIYVSQKNAKIIQAQSRNLSLSISRFSQGRTFVRTCVKNLLIAFFRIVGWKYFKKALNDQINDCLNFAGDKYAGCVVWPIYGKHEVIPSEAFTGTVYVQFEGEMFPAPIGYDIYLRSLYGNYEKDPPVEKQKSHHRYTAYYI